MVATQPPLTHPVAAWPALALLLASSLGLLAANAWPRAGAPVLLTLPGSATAAAFAAPGWRVMSVADFGPLTLIHAMPDEPAASPLGLLRATGGWLVTGARPRAGCLPQ